MRVMTSASALVILALAGRGLEADGECSLNCVQVRNRTGTVIPAVSLIGGSPGGKTTHWLAKDVGPWQTLHVKGRERAPEINEVALLACLPKDAGYALRAYSSPFEAPPSGRRIRAVCVDLFLVAVHDAMTGARTLSVGGKLHVYLGSRKSAVEIDLEAGAAGKCETLSAGDWAPWPRAPQADPSDDPVASLGRISKPFHHISIKNTSSKPVQQGRGRNNTVPTVVHRVPAVAAATSTPVRSDCQCPPPANPAQFDTVNATQTADLCVEVTLSGGAQWYVGTADAGAGFEITKVDITVSNAGGDGVQVKGVVYRNDPATGNALPTVEVDLTAAGHCGFD